MMVFYLNLNTNQANLGPEAESDCFSYCPLMKLEDNQVNMASLRRPLDGKYRFSIQI